jgi:hypothetical protein
MEGLGGYTAYHIHFGDGDGMGADGPGGVVSSTPGTHTFGVLWTTTSVTFVYDGAVVGTIDESLDSPMYIIMENSIGDYGGPTTLPATVTVRYVRVWQWFAGIDDDDELIGRCHHHDAGAVPLVKP